MKNKRPFIILALVLVGFGYLAYKQHVGSKFRYSGTLEAEEIDIQPGVASQIQSVEAREGDLVKAGDVLVKLACQDVRISAANIENDYNRAERLLAAGSLPKASFDRLRFQRQDAAVKLGFCDIAAPSSGTVLSVYRRKGEWARPGQSLLTLADLSQVYAFVYVPKPVLAKLKPGMELKARVPELKNEFKGRVAFIRPEAEFTPKNVQTREQQQRLVFGVKVVFDNAAGQLNPGLPIEVDLPE